MNYKERLEKLDRLSENFKEDYSTQERAKIKQAKFMFNKVRDLIGRKEIIDAHILYKQMFNMLKNIKPFPIIFEDFLDHLEIYAEDPEKMTVKGRAPTQGQAIFYNKMDRVRTWLNDNS